MQKRREVRPDTTTLGRTAIGSTGLGALAWVITAHWDMEAAHQNAWIILNFGGFAALLIGLFFGLLASRSAWGKAAITGALLAFIWPVVELYRHPFFH